MSAARKGFTPISVGQRYTSEWGCLALFGRATGIPSVFQQLAAGRERHHAMKTSHPGCDGLGYISAGREPVTSAAMPHLISANGGVSRVNYKRLVTTAAELFDRLSTAWWIPALPMRLFVGYFFMETGWGKIHN